MNILPVDIVYFNYLLSWAIVTLHLYLWHRRYLSSFLGTLLHVDTDVNSIVKQRLGGHCHSELRQMDEIARRPMLFQFVAQRSNCFLLPVPASLSLTERTKETGPACMRCIPYEGATY